MTDRIQDAADARSFLAHAQQALAHYAPLPEEMARAVVACCAALAVLTHDDDVRELAHTMAKRVARG